MNRSLTLISISCLIVLASATVFADNTYEGTVKAGYISTDIDGNHGVHQAQYNLYEGVALSLERFSARLDNGFRIKADLRNVTLQNRALNLSVYKPKTAGFTFRHNAYRRVFDYDGDVETTRRNSRGELWWQVHKYVKVQLEGGLTSREGMIEPLTGFSSTADLTDVDYKNLDFGVGATFQKGRTTGSLWYRGSDFTDDATTANDRYTSRLRATFATPIAFKDRLVAHGGYQNYRLVTDERSDTLIANSFWGGASMLFDDGYVVRYSFLFDRARRTGDLVATDNISQAIYVGKTWRRTGGLTAGYTHRLNDDVFVERSGNGWSVSGWLRPLDRFTIRAGHGSNQMDIDEGTTLNGKREYSRMYASVRYTAEAYWLRLKYTNKQTENENINTEAEYMRLAADASCELMDYGTLNVSYAYNDGDYEDVEGAYEFTEHIISGDVLTKEYEGLQLGFSGHYLRSKKDSDLESFSVEFLGRYMFDSKFGLEAVYSSDNFDNFADPSPTYSEYYTDNVVRISLIFNL